MSVARTRDSGRASGAPGSAPGAAAGVPASRAAALDALAAAFTREATLAAELAGALRAQRAAVAAGQADVVEASVHATGHLLHLLAEARLARRAALEAVVGPGAATLAGAARVIGAALPGPVTAAADRMTRHAREVAREAGINRAVLRGAIEAGDAFLQALFSAGEDAAQGYGAERSAPRPRARLVDRSA